MDKEQRELELDSLRLLEELCRSEFWTAILWWLNRGYANADSVLHSINCKIGDYYKGKCDVYKELLDLKRYVDDELGKIEK